MTESLAQRGLGIGVMMFASFRGAVRIIITIKEKIGNNTEEI